MKKSIALILLLVIVTTTSCQIPVPTARIATEVFSDYSANVDAYVLGIDETVEYQNSSEISIAIGGKDVVDGKDDFLGEVVFSSLKADGDEMSRIGFGGRWYFDHKTGAKMKPFYSLHYFFDNIKSSGVSLGTQRGLSLGGGIEIPIGTNAFVDASLSYLLNTEPAQYTQTNPYSSIYTSVSGMSLYLGVGYSF